MFGRRNPDRPLDEASPELPENDLDLDLLDDLPDLLAPAEEALVESEPEAPPIDPAWHSATPAILGPSVTRLLQEAGAAEQPAAEPTPPAAVTQQLPPLPPEPPAVSEPLAPAAAIPPAPPASAPVPAARPRTIAESVIGPDDFFDGRYRSERGVRIQGNARGSIESRQYIHVEGGAQVEADLSAEDITVSGDFKGKIACRRRLEVTGTGKVEGTIQTSLLVVQEGGALDGDLHMRGPQAEPAAATESSAG